MKKQNFLIIGTSIFLLCSNFALAKKFIDIKEDNKYYIATRYLENRGIVNGYNDGTFKIDQDITRAELLKIVFEGNKTPTKNPDTNCFPDVGNQEWYSKYICSGKDLKIISGYDDGTFKPNQTVNKAEALKILGEFYKWQFKDPTGAWYSKYIDFGLSKNLLENGDTFDPSENMKRGEMAEILYRYVAMDHYKENKFSADIENKVALEISAKDFLETENLNSDQAKTISRNLTIPETIKLIPGELKIVFSWQMPIIPPEQEKTEFNSYLLEPTDEEISYQHKIDSKVDTILETTNNSETYTIRNLKSDVKLDNQIKDYLFFAQAFNGETTFNDAKVKIEIFDKNGLAKTITAYPKDEDTEPLGNRIWKIFTLDENYEMKIFNSIGSCDLMNQSRNSGVCPYGLID